MKLPIRIKETDQCLVLPQGVDFRKGALKLNEPNSESLSVYTFNEIAMKWERQDEPN